MAEFTGHRFCVGVSNATAALEIAYSYYFANRKWVFIPTLTFVATANVAYRQGVEIKFSDADDKTLCTYSPDVSISLGGYPLSGQGLIADESHYLFPDMAGWANYKARVLSHHAVKPLSSGEGGSILTDDSDFYEYALEYRQHGRNKDGLTIFPGNNVRMTDIQAALLLSQLERWNETNARRHEIAQYYNTELRGYVELPPYHKRHSLHLYMIKLKSSEERDELQLHLAKHGIGTQIHYKPVHQQPLYQHLYADCPVADDHFARSLSIPMHVGLTDGDTRFVVSTIKEYLE